MSSAYNFKKSLKRPKGNQNSYIEEEQTIQWPKEKEQKDKQRSTKHTHKTKDRVTRIPQKTGGEVRCSGRVGSSCSTSDTCRVNLVTNLYIKSKCSFLVSIEWPLYVWLYIIYAIFLTYPLVSIYKCVPLIIHLNTPLYIGKTQRIYIWDRCWTRD